MWERLNGVLRHGLFQNVVMLSGLQLAGFLFPLLTVPYLTRVMGPAA
jgi:O-antigen/teichoic acid export membrane protein